MHLSRLVHFTSLFLRACVVVLVFFSLAKNLGEWLSIHCPPALFFSFLFFSFKVEINLRTRNSNSTTLDARISQQWLSELR